MKQYDVDFAFKIEPGMYEAVAQLEPIMDSALGDEADLSEARWKYATEHGRPLAIVKLSHATFPYPKGVETRVLAEDLSDLRYMRSRFLDLWGDLLHAKVKESLGRLDALFQESAAS